jgi:hypothetical protein
MRKEQPAYRVQGLNTRASAMSVLSVVHRKSSTLRVLHALRVARALDQMQREPGVLVVQPDGILRSGYALSVRPHVLSRVTELAAWSHHYVQRVRNAQRAQIVKTNPAALSVQLVQLASQAGTVKAAVRPAKWQMSTTRSAKPACRVALLLMTGHRVRIAQVLRTRALEWTAQRARLPILSTLHIHRVCPALLEWDRMFIGPVATRAVEGGTRHSVLAVQYARPQTW